jgi:hypothetical protein
MIHVFVVWWRKSCRKKMIVAVSINISHHLSNNTDCFSSLSTVLSTIVSSSYHRSEIHGADSTTETTEANSDKVSLWSWFMCMWYCFWRRESEQKNKSRSSLCCGLVIVNGLRVALWFGVPKLTVPVQVEIDLDIAARWGSFGDPVIPLGGLGGPAIFIPAWYLSQFSLVERS